MTTTVKRVTVVYGPSYRPDMRLDLRCECVGGNITTGPTSGSPNVHHWDVDVLGHVLPGTWRGSARDYITVYVPAGHPARKLVRDLARSRRVAR